MNTPRKLAHTCCSFLLLFLVSCGGAAIQSVVDTNTLISREQVQSRSIAVLALREQENDLRFENNRRKLEILLSSEAFVVVEPEEAEFLAILVYGADAGRDELYSYSVPQFGQTGFSGAHTSGTILPSYGGGATYRSTTTFTPTYGITGFRTMVGSRRVYTRDLILEIWQPDRSGGDRHAKLYEARVSSEGDSGNISEVIDPMLDALFQDFWTTGIRKVAVSPGAASRNFASRAASAKVVPSASSGAKIEAAPTATVSRVADTQPRPVASGQPESVSPAAFSAAPTTGAAADELAQCESIRGRNPSLWALCRSVAGADRARIVPATGLDAPLGARLACQAYAAQQDLYEPCLSRNATRTLDSFP